MDQLISIRKIGVPEEINNNSLDIDQLIIPSNGNNLDIKIWITDLTHTNSRIVSDNMPYGIGCVAAFAEKYTELKNTIKLFKYPQKCAEALEKEIPHIIGFSNFVWNSELSLKFAKEIKIKYPKIITIFGGPHYPLDPKEQEEFLRKHPEIDFYIPKEGEIAFTNLITTLMNYNLDKNIIKDKLRSVHSIDHQGIMHLTEELPRITNLSDTPSPYLTKILDEFFDGKLIPSIQTNRGCPFKCTYCDEGDSYYNRVNKRKQVQVDQELEYIAKRMKSCHDEGGRNDLRIADSNFGMYREDLETCKTIAVLQEKYQWPDDILSDTGKNNQERVIKAAELVNGVIRLKGSVQSLDQSVMKKIKRDNISADGLMQISLQTAEKGVSTISELILCLPGETKQSHFDSILKIIDTGFNHVATYQLGMSPGSEMFTPEEMVLHGLKGRFRIMADCIGKYKLFDKEFGTGEIEKICNETATMSVNDYLECRKMHLIVSIFYNTFSIYSSSRTSEPVFNTVLKFLRNNKIPISDWLKILYEQKMEGKLENIFLMYENATKNELYEDEYHLKELIENPETVKKYLNGTLGYNILHTFRILTLTQHIQETRDLAWSSLRKLFKEKGKDSDENLDFLWQAIKFDTSKFENISQNLDVDPIIETDYDMMKFLNSDSMLLSDFKLYSSKKIRFVLQNHQKEIIVKNITKPDNEDHIKIGNIILTTNLAACSSEMILRYPVLETS